MDEITRTVKLLLDMSVRMDKLTMSPGLSPTLRMMAEDIGSLSRIVSNMLDDRKQHEPEPEGRTIGEAEALGLPRMTWYVFEVRKEGDKPYQTFGMGLNPADAERFIYAPEGATVTLVGYH